MNREELVTKIAGVRAAKEAKIESLEFDAAANLRDEERRLTRQLEALSEEGLRRVGEKQWVTLSIGFSRVQGRRIDPTPEDLIAHIERWGGADVKVNWIGRPPAPCICPPHAGIDPDRIGPDYHSDEACPRFDDGEVFK